VKWLARLGIRLLAALMLTNTVLFAVAVGISGYDGHRSEFTHPTWMPRDVGAAIGGMNWALPVACTVLLAFGWLLVAYGGYRVRRAYPWDE
jgi:hypothetical protein